MWIYDVWLHHCFPGENEGLMQRRKGNRPVRRPASDQVGAENAASDEGGQTQERGLTWHVADGASITRAAADACRYKEPVWRKILLRMRSQVRALMLFLPIREVLAEQRGSKIGNSAAPRCPASSCSKEKLERHLTDTPSQAGFPTSAPGNWTSSAVPAERLTFSGQTKLNRYLAQHRALSNGSSGKCAES